LSFTEFGTTYYLVIQPYFYKSTVLFVNNRIVVNRPPSPLRYVYTHVRPSCEFLTNYCWPPVGCSWPAMLYNIICVSPFCNVNLKESSTEIHRKNMWAETGLHIARPICLGAFVNGSFPIRSQCSETPKFYKTLSIAPLNYIHVFELILETCRNICHNHITAAD
jgi:hypothetical protein